MQRLAQTTYQAFIRKEQTGVLHLEREGTERASSISMKDNKATRPDAFNAGFFCKAWSTVGRQQLNRIMKPEGEDLIQFMESSCLRDYLPLPSLMSKGRGIKLDVYRTSVKPHPLTSSLTTSPSLCQENILTA
jgi:hypothetical protein